MKNFTYLDELIHSGAEEVILDFDIVLGDGEESKYPGGISINADNLIIDGNGHKIDACGKTSIFSIGHGDITVRNISLVNAYSQFSGGAMDIIDAKVELINVEFENNVSQYSGGAIESMAQLTVSDSRFFNNSSNEGGAIASRLMAEIKDCRFEHNSAERGGAIFGDSGLNIEKSYFYRNVSQNGGGAINVEDSETFIFKSNFVENSSDSEGGAILNFGSMRIEDSDFNKNDSKNGGAIFNHRNLIIFNSFFRNNHSFEAGAILNLGESCIHRSAFKDNTDDFEGKSVINANVLKLVKCDFGRHQNYELASNDYTRLTFEECNFRAVGMTFKYFDITKLETLDKEEFNFRYLDDLIRAGKKEIILESDIILNTNEISEFKKGILIDVDDLIIDGGGHTIDAKSSVRIFKIDAKNVTIKNISLKNAFNAIGGAIVNGYGSVLRISNVNFKDNNVDIDGAALVNLGSAIIDKSNFEGNVAKNSGGAIMCLSQMEIHDCVFKKNKSKTGGALVISQFKGLKNEIKINNSKFIENEAYSAGAIGSYTDKQSKNHFMEYYKNLSKIEIAGCEFKGNSFLNGEIFNENILQIKDSIFTDARNFMNRAGDAILINNAGEMEINNCCIKDNFRPRDSVITCYKGIVKLYNSRCINNENVNILISNEDSLYVEDCLFENNDSSWIIVNGYTLNASFEGYNIKFSNNESGIALIENHKFAYIYNTILENNSYGNDCNIINNSMLRADNLKIDDSKSICNKGSMFIKNSLPNLKIEGPGDIQTEGVQKSHKFDFGYLDELIHNCNSKTIRLTNDISIEDYESEFYEGGIELDIDGLVIDGNNKTIDGGDLSRIFIVSADNVKLKNIIFKNGFSFKSYENKFNTIGGAIKTNFLSNLTIENCKFMDNVAEYGGGIGNRGNVKIINCEFINNSSKVSGGALYCDKGHAEIINSKMEYNRSNEIGNIIYSINATADFVDCEFNYNNLGGAEAFFDRGAYPSYYNSVLYQNYVGNKKDDCDGEMQFDNCIFNGDNEKAIYYVGKTNLNVSECDFNDMRFEDVFIADEKIYEEFTKNIEKTIWGGFLDSL